MILRKLAAAVIVMTVAAVAGCQKQPDAAYVPGLGELMAGQQVRHAKLWFAGENENWRLAAYEVDELKEGFGDVVKLHPVLEDSHIPVSKLVPTLIEPPLSEVGAAVEARDKARFEAAFDKLTAACNQCHQAANFGFNVVKRPTSPPFSNQEFGVIKSPV
ncbi:MAG TPA: hypothetical protein VF173_20635 [Thermoanaerobaculia bacterium]|nr:hypothetical protein [Thermoanaerobaculia bacterium]